MGLEVKVAGCLGVGGGISHSRRVGITLTRRNSMRVSTLSEPLPAIARKSRLSQSMPPLTHASGTAPDLWSTAEDIGDTRCHGRLGG